MHALRVARQAAEAPLGSATSLVRHHALHLPLPPVSSEDAAFGFICFLFVHVSVCLFFILCCCCCCCCCCFVVVVVVVVDVVVVVLLLLLLLVMVNSS